MRVVRNPSVLCGSWFVGLVAMYGMPSEAVAQVGAVTCTVVADAPRVYYVSEYFAAPAEVDFGALTRAFFEYLKKEHLPAGAKLPDQNHSGMCNRIEDARHLALAETVHNVDWPARGRVVHTSFSNSGPPLPRGGDAQGSSPHSGGHLTVSPSNEVERLREFERGRTAARREAAAQQARAMAEAAKANPEMQKLIAAERARRIARGRSQ